MPGGQRRTIVIIICWVRSGFMFTVGGSKVRVGDVELEDWGPPALDFSPPPPTLSSFSCTL
jgi:hypothetical protein